MKYIAAVLQFIGVLPLALALVLFFASFGLIWNYPGVPVPLWIRLFTIIIAFIHVLLGIDMLKNRKIFKENLLKEN